MVRITVKTFKKEHNQQTKTTQILYTINKELIKTMFTTTATIIIKKHQIIKF